MTKQIPKKLHILAVVFGLLTATIISVGVASPVFADLQLQRALANNCSSVRISADSEKNVFFDPESGIVTLEVFNPDGKNQSIMLPYQPETGFSGCSQDAKELLVRVKENEEKYIADMCTDMVAIANGEKPLPEKGGKKANLKGAIQFVKKHCGK